MNPLDRIEISPFDDVASVAIPPEADLKDFSEDAVDAMGRAGVIIDRLTPILSEYSMVDRFNAVISIGLSIAMAQPPHVRTMFATHLDHMADTVRQKT